MDISADILARHFHALFAENALAPTLMPSAETLNAFVRYLTLLATWNKRINLTGAKTLESLFRKQIIDSCLIASLLATHCTNPHPRLIDLGSGAGFPALPLRLLWPKGSVVLVEKQGKRASFLRTVIAHLALKGTIAAISHEQPASFDILTSKACLPIPTLLPCAKQLLADQGLLAILATSPLPQAPDTEALSDVTPITTMPYMAFDQPRWLWLLRKNQGGTP